MKSLLLLIIFCDVAVAVGVKAVNSLLSRMSIEPLPITLTSMMKDKKKSVCKSDSLSLYGRKG